MALFSCIIFFNLRIIFAENGCIYIHMINKPWSKFRNFTC